MKNGLSTRLLRALRLLAFVLVWLPASKSHAATITFCAKWYYSYVDQGMGEDGLKHASGVNYGTKPSAHAWAKVTRDGTQVTSGYLNSSGCTSALTQQAGNYVMTVRSYLQQPSGPTFYVRQNTHTGNYKEFSYSVNITSPANNLTYTVALGQATPTDPVPNAMAAATQFIQESHIGLAPGNTHTIVVNWSQGSSAQGMFARLGTYNGVSDAMWKYVIGHEVGHTIQYALFGLLDNDYNEGDSGYQLCNCSHVPAGDNLHCLQSKEEIGSAQNEGWGHFIALDLMNDDSQSDASFIYYKGFRCPSSVGSIPGCTGYANQVKPPPMAFNGRYQHRWLDNYCSVTSTNRGIEIDWMNFYYAVHVTGGGNQFYYTQFRDTYQNACGNQSCNNVSSPPTWSNLVSSVNALYGAGSGRATHWQTNGANFGVDQ